MANKKTEIKKMLKKVKIIGKEECDKLYMEEDIDVQYHHYSPDVKTIFLKENRNTKVRVTHEAVKHIAKRIQKEVNPRWNLGLLVERPEQCAWYTGESDDDDDE